MNKNSFSSNLRFLVLLSFVMTQLLSGLKAEENQVKSDPLVGAAQSTLGRVFGVEGRGGDIEYYSFDVSNHTPKNAALRSLCVPGWGQLFNGDKVKGSLIMGSALITGLAALTLHQKSLRTYDDYVSEGRKDSDLYDDYKRESNQTFILGTVTAVLWGYSIYDAYHNAYNPLWSSDSHRIELAANTEGAQVIWHQKF